MRFRPTDTVQREKPMFLIVLLAGAMLGAFITFIAITSMGNDNRQKEYLEKAITRDVVYAYATTGQYPDTLDYIETKYGLTYDKNKFYIDYRALGRNVYPKITVLEKR